MSHCTRNLAHFNRLLFRPQLLSLFSSKVYYKVAPPSVRNELNLSLLSSAPESVIGRNTPKDHGRPLTNFARCFQRLVEKLSGQNQRAFFPWVNLFCRHSPFREVGSSCMGALKGDTLNWTSFPVPTLERLQKPKLDISIPANLPSSWKIWWRSAQRFWRFRDLKEIKKCVSKTHIRKTGGGGVQFKLCAISPRLF